MAGIVGGVNLSGYSQSVIAGGHAALEKFVKMTTANVKPGYGVMGVSGAEPDVVEYSGTIVGGVSTGLLGVMKQRKDLAIDDAFADNVEAQCILKGSGTIVRVPLKVSAGAITVGDNIVGSATTDGHFELETYTTASTPNTAENKVAEDQNRYNHKAYLGKAQEDSADLAAVRWIKVLI